jgi:excisionase family DNA binding protein
MVDNSNIKQVTIDDLKDIAATAARTAVDASLTMLRHTTERKVQYLTRVEAAQLLRVSLSTLGRRIKDGSIVAVTIGRRVLIAPDEIDRVARTAIGTCKGGSR